MATRPKGKPLVLARPTGTVTFLFSDIEGSTARWERDREAMEPALARHDALMRAALEARGAYVFKTVGDAFCAAFATARDAISAALGAQRALAAEEFAAVEGLRVRMALHAGSVAERDGDYFGPTVNRVARLLAIGYGGQVLVSSACAELLRGDVPPQCSLRDLGAHRLKDLLQPERVYQLVAPDLPEAFPELRSLDFRPNKLPAQLTSFVGREEEVAEVTAFVQRHRLVTLTGAGGVGKTRLSLQVAANLLDAFRDGVWFVELAPLTNGEYLPTTVAQALALTLSSEGDQLENLVRALKEKQTLLVFDNCEHLVEPAARVLAAILRGSPEVKVLASSRQAVGIDGEAIYLMPPLAIDAAVALFVERARSVDSHFSLNDEDGPVVADICRRLDGIPLAIELAAARVRILRPQQLWGRLDERFRLLTGGNRDVLPRHQTLRALIDWSHDLLDDRERVLFRRLGVFVNGFTLEGAVAVGSPSDPERSRGIDDFEVFDVLASLVDKSLVLAEPHGDAVRYRLLESTRAYASEKLDAANERDLMTTRRLRYLREHFEELRQRAEGTAQPGESNSALQADLEEVRAALDAAARSDVRGGAALLADIGAAWLPLGLEAEGAARLNAYLAQLHADELWLRVRLSLPLSSLLRHSGRTVRAFELATEAVEVAERCGDNKSLAAMLREYADMAIFLNRFDDADQALSQAEAIPESSASIRMGLLETRALLSAFRGDLETAAHMFEQLRQAHRSLGNTHGALVAAQNLAEVEHTRGQTHRAITIATETILSVRSGADKSLLNLLLNNLTGYLLAVNDVVAAIAAARESIEACIEREPNHVYVATAIEHLALAFALCGEFSRAARLEAYADAVMREHGYRREYTETTTQERLTALLREQLAPADLARLTAEGGAFIPEIATALALDEQNRESGVA
jgi:predicted ATPase/class 3 adenylate cyclase